MLVLPSTKYVPADAASTNSCVFVTAVKAVVGGVNVNVYTACPLTIRTLVIYPSNCPYGVDDDCVPTARSVLAPTENVKVPALSNTPFK